MLENGMVIGAQAQYERERFGELVGGIDLSPLHPVMQECLRPFLFWQPLPDLQETKEVEA